MFDNVGSKLKGWAKFVAWVGIIASIIMGIVVISGGAVMSYYMNSSSMVFPGIMIMVGGSLASWIGSLFIYAFGDITEKTSSIHSMLSDLQNKK